MDKTKTIFVCLIAFFLVLTASAILRTKHRQELQKKIIFTQAVMRNLLKERQDIVRSVPADGLWYDMRRRQEDPGILEVQIKDQNNRAVCNLKIKVQQ